MLIVLQSSSFLTLIAVILAFGLIGLISFVLYRFLRPKLKNNDNKPNESDIAKEEVDRILVDVEDEETANAIKNYKQNDD